MPYFIYNSQVYATKKKLLSLSMHMLLSSSGPSPKLITNATLIHRLSIENINMWYLISIRQLPTLLMVVIQSCMRSFPYTVSAVSSD